MKTHPRPLSLLLDIEDRERMTFIDAARFGNFVLASLANIVSEEQWNEAVEAAVVAFKKETL